MTKIKGCGVKFVNIDLYPYSNNFSLEIRCAYLNFDFDLTLNYGCNVCNHFFKKQASKCTFEIVQKRNELYIV